MNNLTRQVGAFFSTHLRNFRFIASRSSLVRSTEVGWQSIAIDMSPASAIESWKLAAYAQIRIDSIENLYSPIHPYLDSSQAKFHPTISINCDALIGANELTNEQRFRDEADLVRFLNRYTEEIDGKVLPWLELYSNEEALFGNLFASDPMKWVTSDRLTRYPVLMALLAKQRDWVNFECIASEFDEWCEGPHASIYKPLAVAMKKLHEGRDATNA